MRTTMTINAKKVFESYVEAALWSSTDDQDNPLDDNYDIDDLSDETRAQMLEDCQAFCQTMEYHILTWSSRSSTPEEQAGHDFWLTRNRHGAGFWDGDWDDPAAKHLTTCANAYGEVNLYVGDDGKIYHC